MIMKVARTAREHCAARRAAPFGSYRLSPAGEPSWRKLGGGYLGVADGSRRQYILPGLVFAVEIHDGRPTICRYTRDNDGPGKPYTLASIRHLLNSNENANAWRSEQVTFDEMCEAVRSAYPEVPMPSEFAFFAEYGCMYDREAKIATVYVDLMEDD